MTPAFQEETTVLAAIVERYKVARAEVLANLFKGISQVERYRSCKYCGDFWQHWNGSKLDGHAKCMVPPWFKAELRAALKNAATVSYTDVANALGVSLAVVRSWVRT